jgi:hypothetical protein
MDTCKNMTAFVTALHTNETPQTHGSALVVWSYGTTCLEHDLTWLKFFFGQENSEGCCSIERFLIWTHMTVHVSCKAMMCAKMHPFLCGHILEGSYQVCNETTFAHQIRGEEQTWCYPEHSKDVFLNMQCHCKAYLHLRCNCRAIHHLFRGNDNWINSTYCFTMTGNSANSLSFFMSTQCRPC